MEIFLSKFIPLFVYPAGLLFCLLVLISVLQMAGRRRAALVLSLASVLLLFVAGNDRVAYHLVRGLESDYQPLALADTPEADIIVVLGGGLGLPHPPRLHPDLNGQSDRLLHALRLFRADKAERILLTGGNVFPQPGLESEAYYARDLLELWGIPENAVIMETESRNTIQNAEYSAGILKEHGWNRVLLVTSATHMGRAVMAFRHAGVEVTPVPSDFLAVDANAPEVLSWVPGAGGLLSTTHALHEHLGRLWYRLRL